MIFRTSGLPVDFEIVACKPGTSDGEKDIFRGLADHRVKGEWFRGEARGMAVELIGDEVP